MTSVVNASTLINFHVQHVEEIIVLITTYNMEPILALKLALMVNLLTQLLFYVFHVIQGVLRAIKTQKIVQVAS